MYPLIVLLTDFGHLDPYVGQMKGAILRHAPRVPLVDLCHEVEAGNVEQAAFMLEASHAFFPEKSIFVCVVDPGVGTARRILLARLGEQFFLAPDNGLLDFLGGEATSWWIISADRPAISNTFHGRDIFAPLAARLSLGATPDSLGVPMIFRPTPSSPSAMLDPNTLDCVVRHVDRFGNCLLDVQTSAFLKTGRVWLMGQRSVLEVNTYAELPPGRVGLIAGSQGVMELAMNQGSCARALNLRPGSRILLRVQEDRS